MEKVFSKYIILLPYILGFTQLLQIRGINIGCTFLSFLNIIYIIHNWKIVCKDKIGILKLSILYVLIMLIYQVTTPPLSEIYNPYNPFFYHIFISTGITFWIIGYKNYNILTKFNKNIIAIFIFTNLIYAMGVMYVYGGVANLIPESEIYVYLYQIIPYLTLWITSALFIFKKPLQISIILLFIILILYSTKRGPLVSMGLGFLLIFLFQGKINIKHFFLLTIVLLIGYIIINMYFESYLVEWSGRWTANEDDISNGREDIWELLINHYTNQDFLTIIFGNGYEATHKLTYKYLWSGIGAHNDFIEILYNMGIVGFTIFALLIFSWIKITFFSIKRKEQYAPMLIYLLTCFILGSVVSSNLTRFTTIYFSIYFYYFSGRLAKAQTITSNTKYSN